MKRFVRLTILLPLFITACSSSPEPIYFSLGAGLQSRVSQGRSPSIVITRTSIPELVDRPQLVIQQEGQQLHISEQWRWAGTLRREIPQLIAFRLGQDLASGQVIAVPAESQRSDIDFRLELDVQRFDMTPQVVLADIRWRLLPRQGAPVSGRSERHEPVRGGNVYAMVDAQTMALDYIAKDIAVEIRRQGWEKPVSDGTR